MSNRDVAPRLRALGERVTKLEGGGMNEVQRWDVCDWGEQADPQGNYVHYDDHTALAERLAEYDRWLSGGVYFTNDEFVQHVKEADAIKADLEVARAEHQRTESELNQAQLDKRRAEDDRDEWERHLHIERREHQKAIEERDKARAEVSSLVDNLSACKYDEVANENERLKAALDGWLKLAEVNSMIPRIYVEVTQAALKETP